MATKRVKIAILRARHNTDVAKIPDQACIEMMMTNPRREGVFDYWSDTTRGFLDFVDSELFPWVDISLAGNEIDLREVHGEKAYAATSALPGAMLDGFDGFVVLTLPGTVEVTNPEAGKPGEPATIVKGIGGGAGFNLAGAPACSLPVMATDHTFFCHELGHVLGFSHSYGVFNNGIDWDGKPPFDQGQVYGDPYDVMSSATFGTRNLDPTLRTWVASPTFTGSLPAGWPNLNAASMGPAPAPAHLHHWNPAVFPPGTIKELPYPLAGETHRVRLVGAGRNSSATSLLVLRAPGEDSEGRHRCYVEYRSDDGWDRGLHADSSDLARRAVVVHTLNDAADIFDGGVRCWYRGQIRVPTETDTDLAPAFTPLVIRVIDIDDEANVVEVQVSTSAPREIELNARHVRTLRATTDEQSRTTACGDTITSATRTYETTSRYRASTRGYGGAGEPGVVTPVIAWTVAGQPVTTGTGAVTADTPEGEFTIQYEVTVEPNELALIGRGGERYNAPVTATATEPGGDQPHTANETFHPIGWTTGFSPADLLKLDTCIGRQLERVFIRKRDWLVPPVEDDRLNRLHDRINHARLGQIARLIADKHPFEAAQLRELAEMRAEQLG